MRVKLKPNVKRVLFFLGITLGIECLGSTKANAQMSRIEMAVVTYRGVTGNWPASLEELAQQLGYGLKKEDFFDRWGEPFGYEYAENLGDGFILWSSGPDRKVGTADDIVNGYPPLVEVWKARHAQPVDGQGTDAAQGAASLKSSGDIPAIGTNRQQRQDAVATFPEASSPHRPWLYILIPLCLLPGLYFLLRKLKTRNGKR